MKEKIFRFKQFAVRNHRSAMKVGTDGVLLGAWCNVERASSVLDVGTGTGVIALMVAQRNATAIIDAVEIDAEACSEARSNFLASPWAGRLAVAQCDFLHYAAECGRKYDLIVSNPPYFTEDTTSCDPRRATARHTSVALTYSALIHAAGTLLAAAGRLCIISPVEREDEIIGATRECGLAVARRLTVLPKPGAAAKRTLWELSAAATATQEEELTIETAVPGQYTQQYVALTRDFYLKM